MSFGLSPTNIMITPNIVRTKVAPAEKTMPTKPIAARIIPPILPSIIAIMYRAMEEMNSEIKK